MKTEERHRLQQNSLADILTRIVQRIQPLLGYVGAALIILAVVMFGSKLLRQSRVRQLGSGWREYEAAIRASDPEGLRQVAEAMRNTAIAPRALQAAGMLAMEDAVRRLLTDREGAMETLSQAEEDLQSALNLQRRDPILRSQILLALAQVYESKNELDKAEEQYRQVVENADGHPYAALAADRMKFLNLKDTREFAEWFAAQKVEPPPILKDTPPSSGANLRPPGAYDDLPTSDLSLPSADDLRRSDMEQSFGPLMPPVEGEAPAPEAPPEGSPPTTDSDAETEEVPAATDETP